MTETGSDARFEHVVCVGGTGMLRAATIALAARARVVSSVGRSVGALDAVGRAVVAAGAAHHAVRLDWSDAERFIERLRGHVASVAAFDLLLVWCHDDALAPRLATELPHVPGARCVEVVGSAAADPTRAVGEAPRAGSDVRHTRVVLGFVREGARSRWLEHAEICDGVLAALDAGASDHVVGVVRPWSARP